MAANDGKQEEKNESKETTKPSRTLDSSNNSKLREAMAKEKPDVGFLEECLDGVTELCLRTPASPTLGTKLIPALPTVLLACPTLQILNLGGHFVVL